MPQFFCSLNLNMFFMNFFLFENLCFTFFIVVVYYTSYKSNFIVIYHPKIMWDSSCSRSTQKINFQQFFRQFWRLEYQQPLLVKFKENNLGKIGFLKLLTKENLFRCFH